MKFLTFFCALCIIACNIKSTLRPRGSLFKLKVENGKLRYYQYTTKHPATGAGCFIIMHYEID
nr:MAG TPA: hypothetical protein [Caudoviricetes sp.]